MTGTEQAPGHDTPDTEQSTEQAPPDTEQATDAAQGMTWVTRRAAHEQIGVSISALRKWGDKGKIRQRRDQGGTGEVVLVVLEDVRERAGAQGIGHTATAQLEDRSDVETPEPETTKMAVALAIREGLGPVLDRMAALDRELIDAERRAARAEASLELRERELAEMRQRAEQASPAIISEPESKPEPRRWWQRG